MVDFESILRIVALTLIIVILLLIVLGILKCYQRFLCGGKKIHKSIEEPTCPPAPIPSMKPFEPLRSVSDFNSEYDIAPSSFKNSKDRKISAPTLLFGQGKIRGYPTFNY
jgi:hypothetical protein